LKTTRPTAIFSNSVPPTRAPSFTGSSPAPCSTLLTDQSRTGPVFGSGDAAAGAASRSSAKSDAAIEERHAHGGLPAVVVTDQDAVRRSRIPRGSTDERAVSGRS
jgi:hypothetical protein